MNRLLTKLRYFKTKLPAKNAGKDAKYQLNERSKSIKLMAEKIEVMKDTLTNSSPRSFGLLFILSSLPSFYFVKKLLETEYEDEEFFSWVNRTLKYLHLKNAMFIAATAALSASKFINPASKFTLPKANATRLLLPIAFTIVGLLLPNHIHSRFVVMPAVGG